MPDEREVETPSGIDEVLKETDKKVRKAKLAAILDRGFVSSRLQVALPPGLHGEWVAKDEVDRLRTYGFKFGGEYVKGLHDDGTERPWTGDVVFMVCPSEVKEVMDEIYTERVRAKHGKMKAQQEDKEAVTNTTIEDAHISGFSSSQTRAVGAQEIIDAVKEQSSGGT